MSIIDNLKPKPVTAKTVAVDLAKANADLAALKARLADASLAVVEGKPGAEKALADLKVAVEAARDRITMLSAAHSRLQTREAEEMAAQRASLHKAQLNGMKKHLQLRDAAAEAMATALKEAADQYRIVLDHSQKAERANPIGCGPWPAGAISTRGQLKELVAAQMWKLMPGDSMGMNSPLPGAACHFDFMGKPEGIPTIGEACKANSDYIVSVLTTGKAPGA